MESGIEILLEEGRCTGPEISMGTFFPSDGAGVERAKKICGECPIQEECLNYAIENRIDHGVWGGASERQRRRIARQRRATSNGSVVLNLQDDKASLN